MLPVFQTLVLYAAAAVGLGGWAFRLGPGAVFAMGALSVPLMMVCLVTFTPFGVAFAAYAVLAASACGWLYLFSRSDQLPISYGSLFSHPVIVFPVVFALIALVASPEGAYLPHNWDEISPAGWGTWAQQILAADTWLHPDMQRPFANYPKAWPLAIAFPHVFFLPFDGTRGVVTQFVFHVGVLGLIYDYVRGRLAEIDNTRFDRLMAWAVVIVLVCAGTLWHLLPVNQLIERPLLYTAAGLFVMLMIADAWPEKTTPALLCAGLLIATGFAMKTSGLLHLFPAMAVAALIGGERKEKVRNVLLVTVPFGLVWLFWTFATTSPSPLPFHAPESAAETLDRGVSMLRYLFGYYATYKMPITIVACVGVVWALVDGKADRKIALALAILFLAYIGAMLSLYATSIASTTLEEFPSLERYSRLPLRLLHMVGLILLGIKSVALLANLKSDALWRWGAGGAVVVIVIGGGWQAYATSLNLMDLSTKSRESAAAKAHAGEMRAKLTTLRGIADARGMDKPKVLVIAQGDDGSINNFVAYYGAGVPGSGVPQRFIVERQWSWGTKKANDWMTASTADDVRAKLAVAEVILPIVLDDFVQPVLESLAPNAACAARPTDFIWIKRKDAGAGFECFANAVGGPQSRAGVPQ